jgi:putative NADH-flavin reductase
MVVFGASRGTGFEIVKQALEAGHTVTAFVRSPSTFTLKHPNLTVCQGDAMDAIAVENAIDGQDAVISALGPKGKPMVMAAESTRNIVSAMEKHGVKRLVVISVAGIAVPQDKRGFNLVSSLIKLFLKDVFVDRENQLEVLESSKLDWVVVRVPRLTDESAKGSVNAFFGNASPSMKVTRADTADFMLQQLTSDRWLRQAPILSN